MPLADIVVEGIRAGALGFQYVAHREASRIRPAHSPSITADEDQLVGIARAVGATGTGVLQGISDFDHFDRQFTRLSQAMAEASGRPISLTVEQDARPWVVAATARRHQRRPGGRRADVRAGAAACHRRAAGAERRHRQTLSS
ncbi:MAG: hypothetical protein U5K56_18015 [Halioglobus sp.]|nr:hypothetical protein [Halioglobus sp.]